MPCNCLVRPRALSAPRGGALVETACVGAFNHSVRGKIVGSITCVCAQELEDILEDTRKSFREVYELRNFAKGHTLGWS